MGIIIITIIIKVEFDSYIIPQNEIDINNFRLLDLEQLSPLQGIDL